MSARVGVVLFTLLFAALFAACTGGASPTSTPTPTPDPLALITEAANKIRAADTFRMTVDQRGPDYTIYTDYGAVLFRRADAQYVAPDVMQAAIRVLAVGLRVDVDVFARGEDQWYRAVWTANTWLHQPFAPGFNPRALIAEDTGFRAALDAVIDLRYVGETQLESGQNVLHISGMADGADMNALLIGLIEMNGTVQVDVYIDRETGYPARFVLTETVPGEDAPRVWTMDVLEVNAEPSIDPPAEVEAAAEPT